MKNSFLAHALAQLKYKPSRFIATVLALVLANVFMVAVLIIPVHEKDAYIHRNFLGISTSDAALINDDENIIWIRASELSDNPDIAEIRLSGSFMPLIDSIVLFTPIEAKILPESALKTLKLKEGTLPKGDSQGADMPAAEREKLGLSPHTECLISSAISSDKYHIGDKIPFRNNQYCTITGIYQSQGFEDNHVYLPNLKLTKAQLDTIANYHKSMAKVSEKMKQGQEPNNFQRPEPSLEYQAIHGLASYQKMQLAVTFKEGVNQEKAIAKINKEFESNPVPGSNNDKNGKLATPLQIIDAKLTQGNADSKITQSFLFAFAILAFFLAIMVVSNTFEILLTQRKRQTALLRALGATKREVRRRIAAESYLLGLFAGVLGVAVGIGISYGTSYYLGSSDIAMTIPWLPLVAIILASAILTRIAAGISARRALKVPPLEGLQPTENVPGQIPGKIFRIIICVIFLAAGIGLQFFSTTSGGKDMSIVYAAIAALCYSVTVLFGARLYLPLLFKGLAKIMPNSWVTAKLAILNGARNPRRIGATSSAIMLILGLIFTMQTCMFSMMQSASKYITSNIPVDISLSASVWEHKDAEKMMNNLGKTLVEDKLMSNYYVTPGIKISLIDDNNDRTKESSYNDNNLIAIPYSAEVKEQFHLQEDLQGKDAIAFKTQPKINGKFVPYPESATIQSLRLEEQRSKNPQSTETTAKKPKLNPIAWSHASEDKTLLGEPVKVTLRYVKGTNLNFIILAPQVFEKLAKTQSELNFDLKTDEISRKVISPETSVIHYQLFAKSAMELPPHNTLEKIQTSMVRGLSNDGDMSSLRDLVMSGELNGNFLMRIMISATIDILTKMIFALFAVAALVALVGMWNTLTLSVLERTRENAILRALGLVKSGIGKMLVVEALVTIFVSIILALGAAWYFTTMAMTSYQIQSQANGYDFESKFFSTVMDWKGMGISICVVIVAALLASLLPALSAMRATPKDAMADIT